MELFHAAAGHGKTEKSLQYTYPAGGVVLVSNQRQVKMKGFGDVSEEG